MYPPLRHPMVSLFHSLSFLASLPEMMEIDKTAGISIAFVALSLAVTVSMQERPLDKR